MKTELSPIPFTLRNRRQQEMTDLKQRFQCFTNSFGQGVVLTFVILVSPVSAQQSPENLAPTIDPVANELLQELGQYIDEPEQFTFQAEVEVDEVSPRGQKIQYTSNFNIAVRRPDRLFVNQEGDLQNRNLWFNGDRFILLDRDLNHYLYIDTPDTLNEAIPFLEDRGITAPLADFLTGNFYQGVIANVQTGDYLGLHQVGDRLCHHLAFTQDNVDWQIWIEDGFEIVPCKLIVTYKNLPEAPQYTAYFSDWNFSPRLPDRLFRFVAPEGASEIEFLPQQ
ncbi:hypothetical protein STA3757_27230 [Stanieria sp. NIES-3757]|nr:hypothetical protein STA3757_27230 [Stanieria sp. NIES-3757]